MSGRLQRGRSYARRGQVLEFALAHGQGHRAGAGLAPAAVQGVDHRAAADRRAVAGGGVAAGRPGAVPRPAAGRRDARRDRAGLRGLRARRCSPVGQATWTCAATARTGESRASTWPRSATCWPRRSTTTRSRCSPGAARAATTCSPRCAARPRPARRPGRAAPRRRPRDSPALALLADVTGAPLAESLADFWSPGLSQARLRALPPSPRDPARPAAADRRPAAAAGPRHRPARPARPRLRAARGAEATFCSTYRAVR